MFLLERVFERSQNILRIGVRRETAGFVEGKEGGDKEDGQGSAGSYDKLNSLGMEVGRCQIGYCCCNG